MGAGDRLVAMDRDDVTTEIVLPGEGTATRAVGTDVWLETVGIMSGHVSFEVVGPGKGCREREISSGRRTESKSYLPLGHEGHWYFLRGSCLWSSTRMGGTLGTTGSCVEICDGDTVAWPML